MIHCSSWLASIAALGMMTSLTAPHPATLHSSPHAPAAAAAFEGAWRVTETAVRSPGGEWTAQMVAQGGIYVFSSRHYSYFYVRGAHPRAQFVDANRPTDQEKAAAYDSFIAGAGTYTFDGRTLVMKAEFRKNPNEMTGEDWRLDAQFEGQAVHLTLANPPFLPGRDWRTTLVRAEEIETASDGTNRVGAQPQPSATMTLFDFDKGDAASWEVVNDGVMGGRSQGYVAIKDGALHFTGTLVTQGGGFTSVRAARQVDLTGYDGLELRVRGGGRTFEVEVDDDTRSRGRSVSRRAPFETTEAWTVVRIPFTALRASVFGQPVNAPPVDLAKVQRIGLYILDGQDGPFRLEVDAIRAYRAGAAPR